MAQDDPGQNRWIELVVLEKHFSRKLPPSGQRHKEEEDGGRDELKTA